MLPPLRRQLKTLTNKNQALQDILSTCTAGTRLISVEKVESKVHNTKITVLMPDGRERVHFYNRVDISTVIPEDFVYSPTIPETVAKLNILGLDFHESDFISDGCITLNPFSLGYYGDTTPVVATVPLDTIEFAAKTLTRGGGFVNSVGGYGLFYKVGDETFAGEIQTWSGYERIDTYDIATQIKNEIESFTTDVNVEIIQSDWYEELYKGYSRLDGYIIAITNNLSVPVDVAVFLGSNDDANPESLNQVIPLLPNARLQPKGTKGAAGSCTCGCTGGGSGNDLAFVYDMIPVDGGDPVTLNGADGFNYSQNTWFTDNALAVWSFPYEALAGLNTVVRVYIDDVSSDSRPPDGNPVMMFKNMSDYPVTIDSPAFEEPVVLGPIEYNQPLDRVFINTEKWIGEFGQTDSGGVSINDIEYSFQLSDEKLGFGGDFGAFIKFALDAAGVNAKDIKFAWMREQCHGYTQAYFENTGEAPLKIGFWRGEVGSDYSDYIIPAFILEPAGTVGLPYDLDEDVAFSNMIDEVSEWLYGDKSISNFHWRGVTNNHNNDIEQLAHIFNIGRYDDIKSKTELQYYENISPYVEEVILDYGLATELKIRLRPSRIVTASVEPE